jgi:hypothetical protein
VSNGRKAKIGNFIHQTLKEMESPAVENVLRAVEAMTPEERIELFRQFRKYTAATPETVFYRGDTITIDLPANILKYGELWQLESIAGAEKVAATLHHTGRLDEVVLATLLADVPPLYVAWSDSRQYLVAYRNEVTESDFATLTEINALDAVKRFGLQKVEDAGEKVYTRIE